MELKHRTIVFHLSLLLLIYTQIEAVGSFNQGSRSSVDLKRHDLTEETVSFPEDFIRRQLAGGGGSSGGGGGGSRGGGGSSGGGSKGGSGGSKGGGGGGGNKGGKGGDAEDGDGDGGGGGNSGNTRPTPTNQGGGRPVTVYPGGRSSNGGGRLQDSLGLVIFTVCLVLLY